MRDVDGGYDDVEASRFIHSETAATRLLIIKRALKTDITIVITITERLILVIEAIAPNSQTFPGAERGGGDHNSNTTPKRAT